MVNGTNMASEKAWEYNTGQMEPNMKAIGAKTVQTLMAE